MANFLVGRIDRASRAALTVREARKKGQRALEARILKASGAKEHRRAQP